MHRHDGRADGHANGHVVCNATSVLLGHLQTHGRRACKHNRQGRPRLLAPCRARCSAARFSVQPDFSRC